MTSYLKKYNSSQRLAHRATVLCLLILMLLWGFALGFGFKTAPPAPIITATGKTAADSMNQAAAVDIPQGEALSKQTAAIEGSAQVQMVEREGLPTSESAQNYLLNRLFAGVLPMVPNQQQRTDFYNYLIASVFSGILPLEFGQDFAILGDSGGDIPSRFAPDEEGLFFWNQQKDNVALNIKNPKIAIYSTHSAETYTPFAGDPKVAGKHGGVYVASTVVAETLAEKGIGVIVDDTIHDYPDWNKSYANSRTTASKLLGDHSSVEILIDMHRDAGVPKEGSTVEIDGKSAAKIMLVVGSNRRYKHPNWEQNLAFAEQIGDKMEELYPGLLKTVKVQSGKYNQDLFEQAILVEMGATENTIEEVEYSSQMLANVLAAVLADLK